jgi:hypothetical protein
MAIASTLYAATLCLVMLFSMQTMLRFDLCTELGPIGRYVTKTMCYALSVVFMVGFLVETGRLVAAV